MGGTSNVVIVVDCSRSLLDRRLLCVIYMFAPHGQSPAFLHSGDSTVPGIGGSMLIVLIYLITQMHALKEFSVATIASNGAPGGAAGALKAS